MDPWVEVPSERWVNDDEIAKSMARGHLEPLRTKARAWLV
jgi:hypothetical protein